MTDALQLSTRYTGGPHVNSSFSFVVEPRFHYFVVPQLSLGIALRFKHEATSIPLPQSGFGGPSTSTYDLKTNSYGAAIEIGYNAVASRLVSFWCLAFTGVYHEESLPIAVYPGAVASFDSEGVDAGVYVPVLIHPVDHFFFGVGPELRFDAYLSGSGSSFTGAVGSILGGWF